MPASSLTTVETKDRFLRTGEVLLALAGLLVLAYIKARYIRTLLVNSDETQHLHVVWGWTQGLLQYRDLFDNHAPLFHMAFAPLLQWLGERADILYPMRIAMLPLSIGCLALVYAITSRLYSRRAALWAALFAGLHPLYIHVSTEFRTDNLWSLAWLATLFFLLTGKLTKGRAFTGGLFLGITLCISLKTTLLAGALAIAALLVLLTSFYHKGWNAALHTVGPKLLCGLLGACLVPLAILAFFAAHGALDQLRYCVFEHNMLPDDILADKFDRWNFPLLAPFLLAGAWAFYHSAPTPQLSLRRAIAFLGPIFAMTLLVAYWPLVTRQDFCALLPPVMISVGPALLALARWISRTWTAHTRGVTAWAGPVLALALLGGYGIKEINDSFQVWAIKEDILEGEAKNLKYRLTLTDPGDYIMDAKGETIFRPRPYYLVLERVTLTRLRNDLIENTVRQDCLAKNTPVISTYRLKTASTWLKEGYVEIRNGLWAAGQVLPEPIAEEITPEGQRRHFNLLVAAKYRLFSPEGPIENAIIDGKPVGPVVELAAGPHEITTNSQTPLAIVWHKTERVHYSPFTKKVSDGKKHRETNRAYRIPTNPFAKKKYEP